MTWSIFFLACFVFGFALSAIAFLSGSLHIHAHGHHGRGGHGKFNFGTLAAFIMWFGGTGCILTRLSSFSLMLMLIAATLAGLVGASIIYLFIARVLAVNDKPLDPEDYRIIGALGRVSSPVRPQGTGEMIFVQQGRRQGVPIRSENGASLPEGAEVVVTRYENGIAYVHEWEEFSS